jgi:F5/8 type C domain
MRWMLTVMLLLGGLVSCGDAEQPVVPPQLQWKYLAPEPPQRFVVQRTLDGGTTWEDVGELPGTVGREVTWTDTTLPAGVGPVVAAYRTYAVKGGMWSPASNYAITTRGGAPRVPVGMLTVVSVDSPASVTATRAGKYAADGDPATYWQTAGGTKPPPHPHWIILDLGRLLWVDGVAYLPRQDGTTQGTIAQYEVQVSADNATWSTPVAQGMWVWEAKPLEQYARFTAVEGRYVRLRALTEVSSGPQTSAAEVGIFAGSQPPPIPMGGACTVTNVSATAVTITCPLVAPTAARATAPRR